VSALAFVLLAFLLFAVLVVGGVLLGPVGAVELFVVLVLSIIFSFVGTWAWTVRRRSDTPPTAG
jgi:uncharacterized membrane protein YhaH (DUF805 family)